MSGDERGLHGRSSDRPVVAEVQRSTQLTVTVGEMFTVTAEVVIRMRGSERRKMVLHLTDLEEVSAWRTVRDFASDRALELAGRDS